MHHYNFPPYSVGETGRMRGPGRREIGHGALAERALVPVLPDADEFPYTIRLVSRGAVLQRLDLDGQRLRQHLALMDAGVPIKAPVAGIAMGLIMGEDGNYKVLTDIAGLEDAMGDMDFKVAGTEEGITALQMDIKIKGIPMNSCATPSRRRRTAACSSWARCSKSSPSRARSCPRTRRACTASRSTRTKIGTVIGPGGKIDPHRSSRRPAATIDIEDDGTVYRRSPNEEQAQRAIQHDRGPDEGSRGRRDLHRQGHAPDELRRLRRDLPGKEGLVHISELADDHVGRPEDVVEPRR